MEPRGDFGSLPASDWSLRTASRRPCLDCAESPGLGIPRTGHADSSKRRAATPTWFIWAAGRWPIAAGACWDARRRSRKWSGARTAGCARWMAGNPGLDTPAPGLPPPPFRGPGARRFQRAELPVDFQWLRTPWPDEIFSVSPRGRDTAALRPRNIGVFPPIPRRARQQALCFSAATCRIRAGTFSADGRSCLLLQQYQVPLPLHLARRDGGQTPAGDVLLTGSCRPMRSPPRSPRGRCPIDARRSRRRTPLFAYRVGEDGWNWLPQDFDASIFSDEASAPGQPNFTGAFVGMACQDVSGAARCADFDYFEYREREYLERPL